MKELFLNVAANIVSTLILAFIGSIAYGYFYWKNRRDILQFFGVTRSNPNICVYVSNLNIQPGGTFGIKDVKKGYVGSAITKLEYDGALLIQHELKAKPLALLPRTLQDWLGQKNLELRTIDVPIKISLSKLDFDKNERDLIFKDNLIILGTGIYNSLSDYYLNKYFPDNYEENIYDSYFYDEQINNEPRVIKIRDKEVTEPATLEGRAKGTESAFIQRFHHRFHHENREINVFICAGLSSSATFGSVRYLVENWRKLQEKYDKKDLRIGLLFRNQVPDGELVKQPVPVCENFLRRSKSR